jgi:two-component system chemotaxis sensor kinase CheA
MKQYEELLEFVYVSPFALARIDEQGAVEMMNSMGANLLMEISSTPEISNLFDVLDAVDPGVRRLVADFTEPLGPICEGRHITIAAFGGGDPIVLSLNLLKLGPGRIMAAFGDISKLEAARRAQRFLLDNVSDGLVAVDAAGTLPKECSAMLVRWLGAPEAGQSLWDYLGRADPRFGEALKLGWEAMLEDVLPLELYLEQLPRRLQAGAVPLGVSFQPLSMGGKLTHVLVVLRDLTAQLEGERLEGEQRELMAAVSRLSSDRAGFKAFFDEASGLVRALVAAESEGKLQSARLLHTLKGNAAIFGLTSISRMCHQFEDRLAEGGEGLLERERAALRERWEQLSGRFAGLLGDTAHLTVTRAELAELRQAVSDGASRPALLGKLEALELLPLLPQLSRFAQQAVALGQRLEKAPIVTQVEAHGVRVHPQRFAAFFSAFTHAVRNAVDHGVETAAARAAAGKPAEATLRFHAQKQEGALVLTLSDDGEGIDWEAIARRARASGLPSETRAQLEAALFDDGISSREAVSEVSGRGVGLGALKAACALLEGTIEVESTQGQGTTFRFRFPLDQAVRPPMRLLEAAAAVA